MNYKTDQSHNLSKSKVSLRTTEGTAQYQEDLRLNKVKSLSEEPRLKEWEYWALIKNSYPYDINFSIHHLLIPKRVVPQKQLNVQEKNELEAILEEVQHDYDCQLINFPTAQSVTSHFHIHLLTYK